MVFNTAPLSGVIRMGLCCVRKQALWITVVFAGAFLIYLQIMGTTSISMELSQVPSNQFLYSGNHKETPENKHLNSSEPGLKVNKRQVPFLLSENVTDTEEGAKEVASLTSKKEKSELVEERHYRAMRMVDEKIAREKNQTMTNLDDSKHKQAEASRQNDIYAGNAAAAWSSGAFRYNPYGEPVYNHDNRPNYIPKERVVHIDLKGAPPLPSVYKSLIPWLAKNGATSILLEYEDMFPWEGSLAPLAAKNHYSKEDIEGILATCKDHGIRVIPLVQTFGHLEFALKLSKFSYLREVAEHPQALCPSLSDSQWLVRTMIDQVMALHKGAQYLHIGCDEVYQMGECDQCRLKSRENLFLDHVSKTAKYARNTYKATPIIWHDMLNHISESAMKEYNFGYLVEPMIWVYAEDVYRFVQPSVWTKFSQIFPTVWGASAFKGAFGEQSTVPNVRRHLDNNLNWLDVLSSEGSKFSRGIKGLVLTGWQRHDHFAVLCELLPAAMPSLALNLIATSHGFFNASIYTKLYEALRCMQTPKYKTGLNFDADPFLWDKFFWCYFHGSLVFKSTSRLDSAKKDVRSYIDRVTLTRAWLSDYNRHHNFSSPMRIEADLEELPSRLHAVKLLLKTSKEALSEWFDEWTIGEWVEQHIWPLINQLETLQREGDTMKKVKTWPARPLPILPELEVFGIQEPMDTNTINRNSTRDRRGGGGI